MSVPKTTNDPRNRPMTHLSPGQRLATARAVAASMMPYFRTGILNLVPRLVPGLGTLGVTRGNVLLIDPDVLGKWTPNEAGAVLLHEYMHRYLKHGERFDKLVGMGVLQATKEDHKLWNQCCDAEINDNLEDANIPLPDLTDDKGNVYKPITPETLGVPRNRTAEEYVAIVKQRRPPPGGGGGGQGSGNGDSDDGSGGWGQCGSGAGNPLDNEHQYVPSSDPDARSDVDQQVERRQVSEAIQNQQKSKGNVPAGLARAAELECAPPKVSWQEKLQTSVQNAVSYVRGKVDYTMRKRARRQGALEVVLGENAPILPGIHAPVVEVAYIRDTSGSIGDHEINKMDAEVKGILDAMPGSRLTLIDCDAEVHCIRTVGSLEELKSESAKGGGGTDFRPAFEALDTITPRPSIVVFATDGYGDYPDAPPSDMEVVWLNVGGHIQVDWGEVIDIDVDEELFEDEF